MPFKVKNALATILVTLINIWTTFYSHIWSHWTRSRSCQIFIEFFPDFDFRICKLIDEVLLVTSVWPDWGIYWTLGNFLKPLAPINLPKSSTLLGNICKGVKIYHFSLEIYFWAEPNQTFGDFFLVTLVACGEYFFGFAIKTTAYHLGRYGFHLLLLKSSMVYQLLCKVQGLSEPFCS